MVVLQLRRTQWDQGQSASQQQLVLKGVLVVSAQSFGVKLCVCKTARQVMLSMTCGVDSEWGRGVGISDPAWVHELYFVASITYQLHCILHCCC